MKADLRISIKDFRHGKSVRMTLVRTPFAERQFFVRMCQGRSGRNGVGPA